MRRPLIAAATGIAAVTAVASVLWTGGSETSHAQPPGTDVTGSGVHLTASVDNIGVNPPGDRTPNYLMTFSHAAQLSGNFSINVEGDPISSGQAVAGFLLGCGISVAGGLSVGISPNQGLQLSISPTFTPPSLTTAAAPIAASGSATPTTTTSASPTTAQITTTPTQAVRTTVAAPTTSAPPTTTVTTTTTPTTTTPITTTPPTITTPTITTPTLPTTSGAGVPGVSPPGFNLGPSVGGSLGLSESLTATLEPGQVTPATTATATLDDKTTFPYHITFNNAALNVSQCASPVSAVPFVSTSVSTATGLVQTTAYGDQFTF
ncbi:MspA family porin [Nocardia africana]|uniref:MspA n=1 Tax=Nocardia africana TaxID=134964 RepID=A0A378X2Q9_9NOCA|nr:MspA family porin [Nocardia africana]MCC3311805.1 MspA family porin [Nocardia africana]SUA46921.1 MspA [Nocardia africana]